MTPLELHKIIQKIQQLPHVSSVEVEQIVHVNTLVDKGLADFSDIYEAEAEIKGENVGTVFDFQVLYEVIPDVE